MSLPTPSLILPTRNARRTLPQILSTLLHGTLKPHILVLDSSSEDGTLEEARRWGAETLLIPQSSFNHGTTRELGRKWMGGEIAIFLTQDAQPEGTTVERLIAPLVSGAASVSYGRQKPCPGAHPIEKFLRESNYPLNSHLRSLEDLPLWGAYTFFCSNACAAYSNAALDAAGGFQETLFGEDTIAAAQLLQAGRRIAYVAEAVVTHSHPVHLREAFRRSFDIGYSREKQKELFHGMDVAEGGRLAKKLLRAIAHRSPAQLPLCAAYLAARMLGYFLGRGSVGASPRWCRLWSSSPWYWN